MKVRELIEFLQHYEPEREIGVAATPNVTHWVQGIEGSCIDSEKRLVLTLTEETLDVEEPTLGRIERF